MVESGSQCGRHAWRSAHCRDQQTDSVYGARAMCGVSVRAITLQKGIPSYNNTSLYFIIELYITTYCLSEGEVHGDGLGRRERVDCRDRCDGAPVKHAVLVSAHVLMSSVLYNHN